MVEDTKGDTVRRSLDTESDSPGVEVVEAVADLKSEPPNELTAIWDCINGFLDHIFSSPPAPEAQVEVRFSYEGYRITVDQDGAAKFVET